MRRFLLILCLPVALSVGLFLCALTADAQAEARLHVTATVEAGEW